MNQFKIFMALCALGISSHILYANAHNDDSGSENPFLNKNVLPSLKKQARPSLSLGMDASKSINTHAGKTHDKSNSPSLGFAMSLTEKSLAGASYFYSHAKSYSSSLTKSQAHMISPFYAYIFSPEWVAAAFAGVGRAALRYYDNKGAPDGKSHNLIYLTGATVTYIVPNSPILEPSLRAGLTWTDVHQGSYVSYQGEYTRAKKNSSLAMPVSIKISQPLTDGITPSVILKVTYLVHKLNKTVKNRYSFDVTPGVSIKNNNLTFRLSAGYERNYLGGNEYSVGGELSFPL